MRIVSAPTRPINMVRIITILEPTLSDEVMPRDKPTVEYAEIHSKLIDLKSSSGLKVLVKRIDMVIIKTDKVITAKALRIESVENSVPEYSTLSLPRAMLIALSMATEKVLVLIPPPVLPGEAPIHISNMVIIMEGLLSKE